jgi:hypothetical protein
MIGLIVWAGYPTHMRQFYINDGVSSSSTV